MQNKTPIFEQASENEAHHFTKRPELLSIQICSCSGVLANLNLHETVFLDFHACMEMNYECPYNNLETDEAYFYLQGHVNIHNCRGWTTNTVFSYKVLPLHYAKKTVWCPSTVSSIKSYCFSTR